MSAECGRPPPHVLIKLAAAQGGVFALQVTSGCHFVGQVINLACASFDWQLTANRVQLYLVAMPGQPEPLQSDIDTALATQGPLAVGAALASAGVTSGAWLVAVPTAAAAPESKKRPRIYQGISEALGPPTVIESWIQAVSLGPDEHSGGLSAASLYLGRGSATASRPSIPSMVLPWNCQPGLLTVPKEPFHPAFCGEVKSACSKGDTKERPGLYDELTAYSMLAMLGSYFQGVPVGCHRFFKAPPLAYALVGFAHLGYLVAVEWVGKLRVTAVSRPFFLGSPEHAAAVLSLPDSDMSADYVDLPLDAAEVRCWPEEGASKSVVWRVSPPQQGGQLAGGGGGGGGGSSSAIQPAASVLNASFFKLLRGEGFSLPTFVNLHTVYSALAAACAAPSAAAGGSDPFPPALVPAQLLYGPGQVCVLMPWVAGREAVAQDLEEGGCAVAPVAAAIAWLARQGLLYIDVQLPNVLVEEGSGSCSARLIDYDDIMPVPPVGAAEVLCELLHQHSVFGQTGAFPALMKALAQPW
jgi:hypothetical protein